MEKSYKDKDINAYIDYNKEEKKYYFYTDNSQDGYQLQSLIKGYFESLKNNELITYVAGEGIDYEEINAKYNYEFKELAEDKTKVLLNRQGIELDSYKPMTLADIYNYTDTDCTKQTNKIGF